MKGITFRKILLLTGMLALRFNIQPAKTNGTIYIASQISTPLLFSDPQEYGGWMDVKKLYVQLDNDNFYLKVEYYDVQPNLQDHIFKGTIYLDTDQNPATGFLRHDIGADYEIDFTYSTAGSTLYPNSAQLRHWSSLNEHFEGGESLTTRGLDNEVEIEIPRHSIGNPMIMNLVLDNECEVHDWINESITYTINQNTQITVDGFKSDWGAISPAIADPQGDVEPKDFDITYVYITNNRENLFHRFDVSGSLIMQYPDIWLVRSFFYVYYDTDNNPLTGGYYGAEYRLIVIFISVSSPTYRLLEKWNGTDWILTYEGFPLGFNSTIEFSVPLSTIGVVEGDIIRVFVGGRHGFLANVIDYLPNSSFITVRFYSIDIYPNNFNLMPGESITLTATLKDLCGEPLCGKTVSWSISGEPLLSGTLRKNYSLTDDEGRSFATYTASEVPCEILIRVAVWVNEMEPEGVHVYSMGKVSPNPPMLIPLLAFGVFLLLTRALHHKKFRKALTAIFILGFSFILSYPLGISSNFSLLMLSTRIPAWFLAGLLFLSIALVFFSIFEQSSMCGLVFGICCWVGIVLGLAFPYQMGYIAYSGVEAILTVLSSTAVEGLIFSGILAAFSRIGPRIEKAHIQYSIKKAEKSYNKGNLLQAVKLYAKALSKDLKTNHENVKVLIEQYMRLTKKIIYQAMFRGKEEDKKTLQSAIELQKTLKSNKSLLTSQETNQISQLDFMLEKAQNNDLDFIANDALNDTEFLKSFLGKINKSEILITDLAKELDYSIEATRKLLQEGIEKHKIEGFLALDKNEYISKHHLAKLLYEKIKEAISKNTQAHTAFKKK